MTTIGYQVTITAEEWQFDEDRGIYICNKPVGEEWVDGKPVPTHKVDPTHVIEMTLDEDVMLTLAGDGKEHDLVLSFINHIYANQWMQVTTYEDHAEFRWMRTRPPVHTIIVALEEHIYEDAVEEKKEEV